MNSLPDILKNRPVQAVAMVIGAIVIAIALPGLWSLWSGTSQPTDTPGSRLPTKAQDRAYFKQLANLGESPDTLPSAARLYYYGLLHHIQGIPNRGQAYFEAIPQRFPDSPYRKKLESVQTLNDTIANTNASVDQVLDARARLAIEALPLTSHSSTTPDATVFEKTTNAPWWIEDEPRDVTFAEMDSPYALWPIGYSYPVRISMGGFFTPPSSIKPTPAQALVEMGTAVIPLLREHLSDPRLIDTNAVPPTVGWVCLEILNRITGRTFNEILPSDRETFDTLNPQREPEVLAYIDDWMRNGDSVTAIDTLRRFIASCDFSDPKLLRTFLRLSELGAKEEAIQSLRQIYSSSVPDLQPSIAQTLATLGDTSLLQPQPAQTVIPSATETHLLEESLTPLTEAGAVSEPTENGIPISEAERESRRKLKNVMPIREAAKLESGKEEVKR